MNVVDLVRFRRTRTDLERFAVKNQDIDLDKLLDKIESVELMKQAKNCAYLLCQEPFIAERKDQIYCGKGTCKMAAHRLRNHDESTDLADILARARDAEMQWHGVAGQDATAKQRRDDTLRAAYDALAVALGIVEPIAIPRVFSLRQYVEQSLAPVEPAPIVPVVAPIVPVVAPVEDVELHVEPAPVPALHDPLTPEHVRKTLRAFIAETSFSQGKIARLASTNQPMISQFLSGKTDGSPAFRQSILDLISQDHGLDRR